MTNVLAKLLGAALRRIRGNKISSAETAKRLQLHDSRYRLIESGGQILDPELIIPLKQVEAFKDIQADRLALFISYCYFFQRSITGSKRKAVSKDGDVKSEDALESTIDTLIEFDSDIAFFFDRTILDYPQHNFDQAVTQVIDFLKQKTVALDDQDKIKLLRKQLDEIFDDTLCVFNPLIKGNIDKIRNDLENLEKFQSVSAQIEDLSHKIQGIKDLKLGFDTINAPEFIRVHTYQEIKGTVSNPENLLNDEILENYSSYMEQVWQSSFKKRIKFLLFSEDEKRLNHIVSEYRNEKMYKLYLREYNDKKGEHFQNGIQKIEFRHIPCNNKAVKAMLGKYKEFWYYHSIDNDGQNADGIHYGFMTYSIDGGNDNLKYRILSNKEVKESNRAFDLVWNEALPII